MDLKLVAHAKDYIDALAQGINPLTKQEVPEDDIVNNVKISRCLFFVSQVLGEVIENGEIRQTKREKKLPFDLAFLDLSAYPFSKKPVNISEIAAQINALKPENMNKLKLTALTDWLVDMNLLEVLLFNGKTRKYPTANGAALGIMKEERIGLNGPYVAVLYNESAQHFIIDNLPAILEGGYNAPKSRTEAEEKSE